MEDKAATLMIRYRGTDGVWRRALAATSANGRIRPGFALVDGQAVKCEKFVYHVRYYEDGQAAYESVGTNASEAEAKRKLIQNQRRIKSEAPTANLVVVEGPQRQTLRASSAAYIKDALDRGAKEAAEQARNVTEEFISTVRKTYLDEIAREDILKFHAALRKRGCSDRTVANKNARLYSWFRFSHLDWRHQNFPPKPVYEERLPTIYEPNDISSLLGEADEYLHMVIQVAWKTALRDQELMHLEFSDINWRESTLRVQGKPKWDFRVKDHEQRDIPIPADVLEDLKAWRKKREGMALVLGTDSDQPNDKLLRALKRLAKRARLNCGHCAGCKSGTNECRNFSLHKFRRTCLTSWLRNGFDLRTVQAWAGHKDIESTMRYLRPASTKEVQEKLNSMKW